MGWMGRGRKDRVDAGMTGVEVVFAAEKETGKSTDNDS